MPFDVIIVGAGLTGAAIARDCARRQLRVLLCEAHDIGSGSTAVETGLLDIGACPDRARRQRAELEFDLLRRTAAPLLQRMPLLWPLPAGVGRAARWQQRSRIEHSQLPRPTRLRGQWVRLTRAEACAAEPALEPVALDGAVLTQAWWVDVPHLVALLVRDALEAGAEFKSRARVVALLRDGQAVAGVTLVDDRGDALGSFPAPIVVNCTGAASDDVAALAYGAVALAPVRRTLVRLARRCTGAAIAIGGPGAGIRLVPVGASSLLGCWSAPEAAGDEGQSPGAAPAERLFAAGERSVCGLAEEPALEVVSAVQARAADDPLCDDVARRHRLIDHREQGAAGLLTVIAASVLEHRWVAEQAADRICQVLGCNNPSVTSERPLLGADGVIDSDRLAQQFQIPVDVAERLAIRYGWRAHSVLKSAEPGAGLGLVCHCQGINGAEVLYALRHEVPQRLADLCQRSGLGQGPCGGQRCLREAARIAREAHGWSAAETLAELLAAKQARFEAGRCAAPRLPLAALALDQLAHRLSGNLDRFWSADRSRRGPA